MPLVWELTDELKKWLTPEKLRELNQHWKSTGLGSGYPNRAIENLNRVLQRKEMHYESILGYLQTQSRRGPDLLQAYHGLYSFLASITYGLLQQRHLLNIEYIERNIQYLDGIKKLIEENKPLWIFSLNYDLVIECFAAHFGIPLNSGFTEKIIRLPRRNSQGDWIGHLTATVLPEKMLKEHGLPFFNKGQMGINLLKIHGSLDVFTFQDGHYVLKFLPTGEGIQGVMSSLHSVNHELRYVDPAWPSGVVSTANEIVFADDSGEMQFLRRSLLSGAHKFDKRHSQVIPNELLGHFRSNLNYLANLICIGYGFGDHHINQVIRDWLEFSSDRCLTIVDPKANQIPEIFLHLATQVELVALDCTSYLDQFGCITRTRFEHLVRLLGTWKRVKGTEADSVFADFLRQEMDRYTERLTEWVSTLPMRNGDVDLEQLGLTEEELFQDSITQVTIPSTEEMLEKFLQREGYVGELYT